MLGLTYGTGPATASGGEINLTSEVPDWAYDIWQNAPDPRADYQTTDASSYEGRSGDLADAMINASELVDLGSGGEYELQSSITMNDIDGLGGLVGDPDNKPTVYITTTGIAFNATGGEFVLDGIRFDITKTSDVSLVTTYNTGLSFGLFRDIDLVGQRRKIASGHDGNRHNFMINAQSGGEVLAERVRFLDGGEEVSGEDGYGKHYAIPMAVDPPHQGHTVFKDCEVRGFNDNGFYIAHGHGPTALWNCTAVNNARSNMRPGEQDVIIGGRTEVNNNYAKNEQPGVLIGNDDDDEFDEIVGLTAVAEGDGWERAGLQTFNDTQGGTIRDSVFHFKSGNSVPFEIAGELDTHFDMGGCWILDEIGGNRTFDISSWSSHPGSLTLTGGNQVDSNASTAFRVGSNGTLTDSSGTPYSGQDVSTSQAGVEASLTTDDFPTFYFDHEDDDGGSGGDNGDSPIDLGADNNADTTTNENGVHFEANQEIESVQLTISQNSDGFTTCHLRDATSGDAVAEQDVSHLQAGDSFEISPDGGLDADTYLVTLDADGSEWTRGRFEDPSYPYSNEDLTVIEGVYSGGGSSTTNVRYSFTEIAVGDGSGITDGIDLGTDNNANASSNENGIHFEAERELPGVRVTISQNSEGFTTCRLRDATSMDLLVEKDVSDLQAGDTFEIAPAGGLEADTYLITLDADGSEWTRGRLEDPSYPYSNEDLTVIEGIYSGGGSSTTSVRYSFTAIAAMDGLETRDGLNLGTDNNANASSNENGVHFEPEQELDGIQLTISRNSEGFTTCRLRDATSTDLVAEKDISDLQAGDTFDMIPDGGLDADTYLITLDANGSEWTRGRFEDPSYPYSNSDLAVLEGIYSSGGSSTTGVRYSFTAIAGIYTA